MSLPVTNPQLFLWVENSFSRSFNGLGEILFEPEVSSGFYKALDKHLGTLGGSLEMIELDVAYRLTREMRQIVKEAKDKDLEQIPEATTKILKQCVSALRSYLNSIKEGTMVSPLTMLSFINLLREHNNKRRLSSKRFFTPSLDWSHQFDGLVNPDVDVDRRSLRLRQLNRIYQETLLTMVVRQSGVDTSLRQLKKVVAELEAASMTSEGYQFWWVARGFLDVLKHKKALSKSNLADLGALNRQIIIQQGGDGRQVINEESTKLLVHMLYMVGVHTEVVSRRHRDIKNSAELDIWFLKNLSRANSRLLNHRQFTRSLNTLTFRDGLDEIEDMTSDYFARNGKVSRDDLLGKIDFFIRKIKRLPQDDVGDNEFISLLSSIKNAIVHLELPENGSPPHHADLKIASAILLFKEMAFAKRQMDSHTMRVMQQTQHVLDTMRMGDVEKPHTFFDQQNPIFDESRNLLLDFTAKALQANETLLTQFVNKHTTIDQVKQEEIEQRLKMVSSHFDMLDYAVARDLSEFCYGKVHGDSASIQKLLADNRLHKLIYILASLGVFVERILGGDPDPSAVLGNAQHEVVSFEEDDENSQSLLSGDTLPDEELALDDDSEELSDLANSSNQSRDSISGIKRQRGDSIPGQLIDDADHASANEPQGDEIELSRDPEINGIFVKELGEHLRGIEDLIAIDAENMLGGERPERLLEILHTMEGNSGNMRYPELHHMVQAFKHKAHHEPKSVYDKIDGKDCFQHFLDISEQARNDIATQMELAPNTLALMAEYTGRLAGEDEDANNGAEMSIPVVMPQNSDESTDSHELGDLDSLSISLLDESDANKSVAKKKDEKNDEKNAKKNDESKADKEHDEVTTAPVPNSDLANKAAKLLATTDQAAAEDELLSSEDFADLIDEMDKNTIISDVYDSPDQEDDARSEQSENLLDLSLLSSSSDLDPTVDSILGDSLLTLSEGNQVDDILQKNQDDRSSGLVFDDLDIESIDTDQASKLAVDVNAKEQSEDSENEQHEEFDLDAIAKIIDDAESLKAGGDKSPVDTGKAAPVQVLASDNDADSTKAKAVDSGLDKEPELTEPVVDVSDDVDDTFKAFFVEEATDVLAEINQNLHHWEENPKDEEVTQVLRRNFHTLKGSAAMTGFERISVVSHHVESLFDVFAERPPEDNTALIGLLEEVHDGIAGEIGLLSEQNPDHLDSLGKMLESMLQSDDVSSVPVATEAKAANTEQAAAQDLTDKAKDSTTEKAQDAEQAVEVAAADSTKDLDSTSALTDVGDDLPDNVEDVMGPMQTARRVSISDIDSDSRNVIDDESDLSLSSLTHPEQFGDFEHDADQQDVAAHQIKLKVKDQPQNAAVSFAGLNDDSSDDGSDNSEDGTAEQKQIENEPSEQVGDVADSSASQDKASQDKASQDKASKTKVTKAKTKASKAKASKAKVSKAKTKVTKAKSKVTKVKSKVTKASKAKVTKASKVSKVKAAKAAVVSQSPDSKTPAAKVPENTVPNAKIVDGKPESQQVTSIPDDLAENDSVLIASWNDDAQQSVDGDTLKSKDALNDLAAKEAAKEVTPPPIQASTQQQTATAEESIDAASADSAIEPPVLVNRAKGSATEQAPAAESHSINDAKQPDNSSVNSSINSLAQAPSDTNAAEKQAEKQVSTQANKEANKQAAKSAGVEADQGEKTGVSNKSSANRGAKLKEDKINSLLNTSGEISLVRNQLKSTLQLTREQLGTLRSQMGEIRQEIRDFEVESDAQIRSMPERQSRLDDEFDPLQLDRYTPLQMRARSLSEQFERLASVERTLEQNADKLASSLSEQDQLNEHLQAQLLTSRMIPLSDYQARWRHLVRETARKLNKTVKLNLTGTELTVDRQVLDVFVPALEHMIRNSISHGIESSEQRTQSGKDDTATITLTFDQRGSDLMVRIEDDGSGIDREKVAKLAVERHLLTEVTELNDEQILNLICYSGFSTAASVTMEAGRGVGMDVVYQAVRQLGGSIALDSKDGVGASFEFILPVSVSVNQALIVNAAGQQFGIPSRGIERVMRVPADELRVSNDNYRMTLDGNDIEVRDLATELKLRNAMLNTRVYPIVILRLAERLVGILVDGFAETVEAVSRSTGSQLQSIPGIVGASLIEGDEVLLLLDPGDYFNQPIIQKEEFEEYSTQIAELRRVLVVDDAIVVRRVMERDINGLGIEVVSAGDGVQALEMVNEIEVDLILLDIEMPNMNGYELLEILRKTETFKDLPVIMVTSRATERHEKKAMDLGANGYITKPYNLPKLHELMLQLVQQRRA